MRLIKVFAVLLFSLLVLPAYAGFTITFTPPPLPDPDRQWNIVCFEKQSLTAVLDNIVNAQQFVMNDPWQTISQRKFNKLGCDYVQIPQGSQARRVGIHETMQGFIFPVFQLRYSNSGQRMYTADAIFLSEHWNVSRHCGQGHNSPREQCIVPKNCEVLDGFVNISRRPLPNYIVVPSSCRSYTVM